YSFLLFLLFYYISLSDLYTLSLHDALPIYCYLKIAFNTFFLIVNDLNPALDSTSHPFGRRESFSSRSSLTSLPSQWSNCGPMDSDRKSTRLNSSHEWISYAVFCLKKKKII